MDDLERRLARLRKLLALAAGQSNSHESALAARKAVEYLEAYPLPIRWLVRRGIEVRILPAADMTNLTVASRIIRTVPMRRDNWFLEIHRVKDPHADEALKNGFLYFNRHGYAVFVPAKAVEVYV